MKRDVRRALGRNLADGGEHERLRAAVRQLANEVRHRFGDVVDVSAFVAVERRSAAPLIDPRLLRVPAVGGSLIALLAYQFAILGLTVYLTLYLQHVLRYSPAVAGALILPAVAFAPLLSSWVGRRTDRRGSRGLTVGALVLAALAVFAVAVVADRRAVLALMVPLLACG